MRSLSAAFVTATWLGLAPLACAQSLDETAAAKLLVGKIQERDHQALTCRRVILENTTSRHFAFVVREKHDGKCPGDPAVEPVVDRFRISRSTKEIFRYDAPAGEYVPYSRIRQKGGR